MYDTIRIIPSNTCFPDSSALQFLIEQNRCAMACQGYGAVFLYTLIKKQWKPSPTSSILQTGIVTPK